MLFGLVIWKKEIMHNLVNSLVTLPIKIQGQIIKVRTISKLNVMLWKCLDLCYSIFYINLKWSSSWVTLTLMMKTKTISFRMFSLFEQNRTIFLLRRHKKCLRMHYGEKFTRVAYIQSFMNYPLFEATTAPRQVIIIKQIVQRILNGRC